MSRNCNFPSHYKVCWGKGQSARRFTNVLHQLSLPSQVLFFFKRKSCQTSFALSTLRWGLGGIDSGTFDFSNFLFPGGTPRGLKEYFISYSYRSLYKICLQPKVLKIFSENCSIWGKSNDTIVLDQIK